MRLRMVGVWTEACVSVPGAEERGAIGKVLCLACS